jgi:hypothetical protein
MSGRYVGFCSQGGGGGVLVAAMVFAACWGVVQLAVLGSGTNLHLAWSAMAGLGVGLAALGRGLVRLLGPLLVVLVGADHAAYNFYARHPGDTGLGGHLATPFVAAQPMLWLWPLQALAVAVTLDLHWLHPARGLAPDLRLRREHEGTAPATAQLVRYALLGLPWTPLLATAEGERRGRAYRLAAPLTGRHGTRPPASTPPLPQNPSATASQHSCRRARVGGSDLLVQFPQCPALFIGRRSSSQP